MKGSKLRNSPILASKAVAGRFGGGRAMRRAQQAADKKAAKKESK